ncbi:MAG: 16S rRNA (cytidine(1402)-2'-O)-methyltransferase, partial [Propionibacteriaceae bacterium]|nr:16S rRNA (cytidine(1402)-2'-O)-methyltransferase [Propionibacteriaceae bacterium]
MDTAEGARAGRLVLAGTPIGDRRDAAPALLEALQTADLIAAEDTRRFRTLTARLGIEVGAPVISYFEGNEAARAVELAVALAEGQTVVLVTDAGMPLISDPGYRLVRAALAAGA